MNRLNIGTPVVGFFIAVAASLSWALGNVITKYSANNYDVISDSLAIYDIAICNFLGGSIALLVSSIIWHKFTRDSHQICLSSLFSNPRDLLISSIFKTVNTVTFTACVALISSGIGAAIENTHVVITSLIMIFFFREAVSFNTLTSAVLIVFGSFLILNIFGPTNQLSLNLLGVFLAITSAVSFSLFTIFWRKVGLRGSYGPQRAIENAFFLLLCTLLLIIYQQVVGYLGNGYLIVPLTNANSIDVLIQIGNGTFNIGLTYFLMSESLRLLNKFGSISSIFMSLGISYSVLFTFVIEIPFFGFTVTTLQWIGIVIYTIGFTITKVELRSKN